MSRLAPSALILALATVALAACGTEGITLNAKQGDNARLHEGAQIFSDHCSGCHTLDAAGAQGSAYSVRDRERTDGPNFNVRAEQRDSILYAIRNGGFSGAIMPANIITGDDAQKVADYLSRYAGVDAVRPRTPNSATP